MVDGEAQLLVAEFGHVGRACRLGYQLFTALGSHHADIGIVVVGRHDDCFAVIAGNVVVQVAVHVGDGGQREVDGIVVAAQVDAVLLEVEGDGDLCRCQFLALVAHVRGAVQVGVVHTRLYQTHQVGE